MARRICAVVSAIWSVIFGYCTLLKCCYALSHLSRRNMIQNVATTLVPTSMILQATTPIGPAHAARGAAELDLEYYARDWLGGNKKEGNVLPSKPPELAPPRHLKEPLLSFLLNDDDHATACIPILSLTELAQSTKARDTIQQRLMDYREKARRSFAMRAPWSEETVADQYYFDLTAYALWRTAADLLPDYRSRDVFVRNVGRQLYHKCQASGLIPSSTLPGGVVSGTVARMNQILDMFQAYGYCKSFCIGDKVNDDPIFDELDDEAVAGGASVDCLVSVFEPATLGASLQITGEQSRFAPDYVGSTLAAMWEAAGLVATWETFFVDNEYRPNPKDYFPNEQLFQFTLTAATQSPTRS